MRFTLFTLPVLMVALSIAGCSKGQSDSAASTSQAQPQAQTSQAQPGTAGTLTVRTGTGTERFPVPGVAVRITPCSANTAPANLTTDKEGTVTQHLSAGCYRAAVTGVPSGCGPDAVSEATADVKANDTATLYFLIHCA